MNMALRFDVRPGARRSLIVGAVFAVLVYLGFQSSRGGLFLSSGGLQPSQDVARASQLGEALRLLDAGEEIAQSGIGHLMFSIRNSEMCRRVLFDNRTGASADAGRLLCGVVPEPNEIGQERALAMLRAFRK